MSQVGVKLEVPGQGVGEASGDVEISDVDHGAAAVADQVKVVAFAREVVAKLRQT